MCSNNISPINPGCANFDSPDVCVRVRRLSLEALIAILKALQQWLKQKDTVGFAAALLTRKEVNLAKLNPVFGSGADLHSHAMTLAHLQATRLKLLAEMRADKSARPRPLNRDLRKKIKQVLGLIDGILRMLATRVDMPLDEIATQMPVLAPACSDSKIDAGRWAAGAKRTKEPKSEIEEVEEFMRRITKTMAQLDERCTHGKPLVGLMEPGKKQADQKLAAEKQGLRGHTENSATPMETEFCSAGDTAIGETMQPKVSPLKSA